jgi:uncharacterized protein
MTDENKKCGCSKMAHIAMGITLMAVIGLLLLNYSKPAGNTTPAFNPTIEVKSPDTQRNTLTVSGNAQLSVTPDKATVLISVLSDNKTAKLAQENNRDAADAVLAALKSAGLNASDIETESYSLSKLEDWEVKYDNAVAGLPMDTEAQKGKIIDRGYRLTHTIKATTRQIDKVGDLIDAAVGAGANGVDSISFGLSKEAEKKVRDDAMVAATQAAKEKAQRLSQSADAKLGKVITISEQSFYYTPYEYNVRSNIMLDGAAGAPSTAISPQKVEVTSGVMLVYEIN